VNSIANIMEGSLGSLPSNAVRPGIGNLFGSKPVRLSFLRWLRGSRAARRCDDVWEKVAETKETSAEINLK